MKQLKIITYALDDDKEELELLSPYLEKVCGCDFQLYTDINDFIRAIEQGCHIAIIDHQLNAKVDGIDVGKEVLHKNPLCFLILFTGTENKKTLIRATNSGFKYIVDKNDKDAYEQVANAVSNQLQGIVSRIEIFNKWYANQ